MELARRPTVSRDRRDPPAAIEDSGRPRAQLYFWVLVGITLGILLGYFFPAVAVQLEPLGDSFVNLIKMVIAPVIFCTVVVGLDGTSIYLTLAAIYVAQAQNVRLSIGQQLAILAVLLLTSKGAAGVTGSGFIVLAATLSAVGRIPVAGIMLIFGIDKFMSECRALVNATGNTVASIVVSRWEGDFDADRARQVLDEDGTDELDILTEEEDTAFRREPAASAGVGPHTALPPVSS